MAAFVPGDRRIAVHRVGVASGVLLERQRWVRVRRAGGTLRARSVARATESERRSKAR